MKTLGSKLLILFILTGLYFLLIQGLFHYVAGWSFLAASSVGMLLLFPLGYFLSRFATRPLQEIVTMLKVRIAAGPESKPAPLPTDEFGMLARAIDEMTLQLKSKIEEVATEKDMFQTILSGMVEGVLVVDERSRILLVNEALRNFLPLSSDVTGQTPLEVIRNAELEETIQRVIRDGGRGVLEVSLPSTDEKILEVNVVGLISSPQKFDRKAGKMGGAIAVFHDITRLKRLENVRQDFVANVSHELRTPLTTIKGYVETLLDGAIQQDVAVPFIQVIKRHTDRLEKIVEDLLILSKVETKTLSLKRESVSLKDLTAHAVELVKESAEKKNISLSCAAISPIFSVYGERRYLEQVLINLLDNAIKYGHEGGKIRVSAVEKDQNQIQISVEDDGIGIPREDLPRIFERFYRVDKGRSKELGGTGLGLSIVKHIVQAHGGNVWAESEPEKGSTFYLTLPGQSSATD